MVFVASIGAAGPVSWRDLVSLQDIRQAADRLAAVGVHTPLQRSERLSNHYGATVFLKREDTQTVRSYKIRGAYNFLASLTPVQLDAGVVCASAGNHGQGVAWSCRRLGVKGDVFVPLRTPRQKVSRIEALGGQQVAIHLVGGSYDDASAAAQDFAARQKAVVVPGFDHPVTIAGQGTVALEILGDLADLGLPPPDLVVTPVGGGGLLSGTGISLEALAPATRHVGAQPAGAPAMIRSLAAGEPVSIEILDDFVDGAVVGRPGALTYAITAALRPELLVVDEGAVCTEMLALYQEDGIVAEPAGALSIAALRQLADRIAGTTVVCILSGGNNDVTRYDEIIERSLVAEGLKHYFVVEFPQQPGALRHFLDSCLGPGDDIVLFEYMKKSNREFGPALVGVEIGARDDLEPLLERITESGLHVERVPPDSPMFRFLV
jgi:threonine dehydratase